MKRYHNRAPFRRFCLIEPERRDILVMLKPLQDKTITFLGKVYKRTTRRTDGGYWIMKYDHPSASEAIG